MRLPLLVAFLLVSACDSGGPEPDTTPPTVTLTSPAQNATLTGPITARYTATDAGGISSVVLLVDGTPRGVQSTQASGSLDFDPLFLDDGPHTLAVQATDAAGNVATSNVVTVTTANDATGATVTRATLEMAPFTRPDGTGWDATSAPDFVVVIRRESDLALVQFLTIQDATPASLPASFVANVDFSPSDRYRVELYDEDVTDFEFIGQSQYADPGDLVRSRPPTLTFEPGAGALVTLDVSWTGPNARRSGSYWKPSLAR